MKRFISISLAAIALSLQVSAQGGKDYLITGNIADNSFISLSGGASGLWCPGACKEQFNPAFCPSMDFSFGRWLAPAWGGRIGVSGGNMGFYYTPGYTKGAVSDLYYEGMRNGKPYQEAGFMYIHMDLMHNWQNLIKINPDRFFNLMPYVHVGIMLHYGTESAYAERVKRSYNMETFAYGAGLINTFRVSRRVNAFLDLRATLQTPRDNIDWLQARSMQIYANAGLSFHIGNSEWYGADGHYSRPNRYGRSEKEEGTICNPRYFDNTFVQVLGGFNIGRGWATGFHGSADVSIGKWFGPYVGGRTGWLGGWRGDARIEFSHKEEVHYFHGDLLLNFSNMFGGIDNDRFWSAVPYLHCGLANHDGTRHPLGVGGGFLQSFKLGDRVDLNVDARYLVQGRLYREIFITAGATYNIGRTEWNKSSAHVESEREPARWAVYTNVGEIADATFNAGVQYSIARHCTVDAHARVNVNSYAWNSERQNQMQLVSLGARWWPWCTYSGIWVKCHLLTGLYRAAGKLTFASDPDIPERGNIYGTGLTAGYSLPVSKFINLEAGIGMLGGFKSYLQYEDASFRKTISPEIQRNGFCRLWDLNLTAVVIF